MRSLRGLGIYVIAVFLGGALVAPWCYWLAQALAPEVWPKLASQPFHRYVSRAFEVIALAGMWPLLRSLGTKSPRDVGLARPAGHWRQLEAGLTLGLLSLALVGLLAIVAGARTWDLHAPRLGEKLLGAALAAGAVAVLEEVLFRGLVFGALRRVMAWEQALLLSSVIYALLHFLESAKLAGPVTWYSGLELLPRMLHGLTMWERAIPGFFNLTLAGLLLGLAYQRTGALYYSIGLHAGWIFCLKSYGSLTRAVPGVDAWFWGTGALINGWLAGALLALMLALAACLPQRETRGEVAGTA